MADNADFWGLRFTTEGLNQAARRISEMALAKYPSPIRLVNAYSIAAATSDARYGRALKSSGINYADGAPVAAFLTLMSWQQGGGRHRRVRGPSLFEETLRHTEGLGISHLFFGASKTTLADLESEIRQRYPRLTIAGYVSPPIADVTELTELAKTAHEELGGDIVWLGLGTPKQDLVARDLAEAISRPCVAVGAAFDFLAGTQSTAPRWMQRSGTEWIYRFASEPKRLWRRYTVGSARFLAIAFVELNRGSAARYRERRHRRHGIQQR